MSSVLLLIVGYFIFLRFLNSKLGKSLRYEVETEVRRSISSTHNRNYEQELKERKAYEDFIDKVYE